jgi:hypothetical protein
LKTKPRRSSHLVLHQQLVLEFHILEVGSYDEAKRAIDILLLLGKPTPPWLAMAKTLSDNSNVVGLAVASHRFFSIHHAKTDRTVWIIGFVHVNGEIEELELLVRRARKQNRIPRQIERKSCVMVAGLEDIHCEEIEVIQHLFRRARRQPHFIRRGIERSDCVVIAGSVHVDGEVEVCELLFEGHGYQDGSKVTMVM